jgi:hypothetical protein
MSILNWLIRRDGPQRRESGTDLRVRQAIELAVMGIDAGLRLVKNYPSRMLPAVESALAHCSALAASIPGPIDLRPDAWERDTSVRALFVQPEEIDQLLGRSLELLAFAAQPAHSGVDELCAAISLMRTEQKMLGWANQGEILQKDVVQRAVSFSRHRLLAPSVSVAELRREIEWRAYEHLVVAALGHLFQSAGAAPPRGRVSALLRERLQLLQRARAGLEALHQPPVENEAAFHSVRQHLIENGRQLESLHRRPNTLEERLERVVEVLAKPADVIAFGRIEDRLTSLNIVASSDGEAAAYLNLAEISIKSAPIYARTTAIVRLSRCQLKPRRMDFAAAEGWL